MPRLILWPATFEREKVVHFSAVTLLVQPQPPPSPLFWSCMHARPAGLIAVMKRGLQLRSTILPISALMLQINHVFISASR